MYQLRKLLNVRTFAKGPSPANVLHQLKERRLLKISGIDDVRNFLQGIITNDIRHLGNTSSCLYTLMLNNRGRVMHDILVYQTREENALFLECSTEEVEALQKRLRQLRVKRKITIDYVDNYLVYVVFNSDTNITVSNLFTIRNAEPNISIKNPQGSCGIYNDILTYNDPRLKQLGVRILAPAKLGMKEQVCEVFNAREENEPLYRALRYTLGVGEGVNDLPPNNCFPLECNCDFMHGISFHKGCYIGQELTARTHHTGVVRKRLMPLFFKTIPTVLPSDNVIIHRDSNFGKLRGIQGIVGLALLHVTKALECSPIPIGNGEATILKPSWWPIEAPKARSGVNMEDVEAIDERPKLFQCSTCMLNEKYEYYGSSPSFVKDYKFKEDVYVIEDPFSPPNKGEFIVLGAHCIKCNVVVCKDVSCSFYFGGTYCIKCAKESRFEFPESVREKLNRIVVPC